MRGKDAQSPVKCRTKFRGNNDAEEKTVQPPAKFFFCIIFFWRSPVFDRKKTLNLRFGPEKAFEFRQRSFFLIFLEITEFSLHLNPIQGQ